MSFLSAITSFFHPNQQQQQQTVKAIGNKIPVAGGFMKHYQDIDSYKKGGTVKKTGPAYLHKGEIVVPSKLAALIKSGEGPQRKGYEETFKTVPKKKVDFNKDIEQYKKTGFFKTKVDGGGHDAGYLWAKEKKIDPFERKRKYGRNSPSFDHAVYAYKQEMKQKALSKKMK